MATVRSPSSLAARKIRMAISLRLAASTLRMVRCFFIGRRQPGHSGSAKFSLFHGETDSPDYLFQCSETENLILAPFQLVPANPFENTLSVFASDACTSIWPKWLERR